MNITYGVHPSVLDRRAMEDFERFHESADATGREGGFEQGESSSVQNNYTPKSCLKSRILVTNSSMT